MDVGGLKRRRGIWRGAIGVMLAYALVLQAVFAGALAERMVVSDITGGAVLCLPSADEGASDAADHGTAAHLSPCVICAFAALTPPLPERAGTDVPGFHAAGAPERPRLEAAAAGSARHDPRTSQGPPRRA